MFQSATIIHERETGFFFWIIPENISSVFSIHEKGKLKTRKKGVENRIENINRSLSKSVMLSHLENLVQF